MNFSTIAAVSTPRGKGGVAVLRISGDEALSIAQRVFFSASGKTIRSYPPRTQIYGRFTSADQTQVLDDGLLTYFASPASFTGEDVVEIACHGGEVVTAMILSALLEAGAVPAQAGEFSRRAFLNGKLSLTAAEGIADLLDARTEEAALLSSKTARGTLSAAIEEIADAVLAVASSLWAYLDYPEEDLQGMNDDEMISSLEEIMSSCRRLVSSYTVGRAVNSGISATIVGKPNVGKSTFFNALLGEEKAIVTDIPGTTRDVIEYPLKMGKLLLNLADTAGVRGKTEDSIEKIGIERSLHSMKEAELIFALFDRSRPLDEQDRIVLQALKECTDAVVFPILTKGDLPSELDEGELPFADPCFLLAPDLLWKEELCRLVEERFIQDEAALREGRILTNARQKASLEKALFLLEEAKEQICFSAKDLASLQLEAALAALYEIDGKAVGEMILNQVFSRFCIGK
jgi:tRNA modification GTPase